MQTKLATALRQQFALSLNRILPGFQEDRKIELPPGWRAYRCEIAGKFTAFVILCLSPKDDRFTVELAWSAGGQFPASSILQAPDADKSGESLRLASLWHPQRIDFWWGIGRQRTLEEMARFVPDQRVEEKLLDIDAKVADAMTKLQTFGIPFFKRIADSLGASIQPFEASGVPHKRC